MRTVIPFFWISLTSETSSESGEFSAPLMPLRASAFIYLHDRLWIDFCQHQAKQRKNGGGGGSRTRVPSQPTSRDYMLSLEIFFCYAMASKLDSHCLVRMRFSRPTTRGLRCQPCLLLRPSTVAGVQWRTSRQLRPRGLILR